MAPSVNHGAWQCIEILVVSPTPTHPQDHGNRKRVFELCSELKRQGAKIHLVHYASERDWRTQRPLHIERQMAARWDSYQLVAPSRPVHDRARGFDHTIDEWADPALTGYIRWAFGIQRYDMVIVEYTWMSFCLDAVPPGVFKVIDTHDVFSGRRALLAANGIGPEFFHTTPPEEQKGLARADLVWAIKESEQRYFEDSLGLKQCLTLPYAEALRDWWRTPPSQDGWLRVGIIGARNNINRRNIEAFLQVALPTFQRYMAPVKIVIAGGCSDDFLELRHRNVELAGRIAAVKDFYCAMDVISTPIQSGTGLKIKVAEALASGAPLVGHSHAMEGFPTSEPLHSLPDFQSMSLELVKLSFERSGLHALSAKSHATMKHVQEAFLKGLESTRNRFTSAGANSLCIIVPMEAFSESGMLYDHLYAAINYLRFSTNLIIYVTGDAFDIDPGCFKSLGADFRAFVSPRLADELHAKLPERWTRIPFDELLQTRGIEEAYFLTEPPDGAECHALRKAWIRCDAVQLSGADPQLVVARLAQNTKVGLICAELAELGSTKSAECAQIAYRRASPFASFAARLRGAGRWNGLLALSREDDPLLGPISELAATLQLPLEVLDLSKPGVARSVGRPSDGRQRSANVAGARLVVDMGTISTPAAGALLEGAKRAGVPVVRLARGAQAAAMQIDRVDTIAISLFELFRAIACGAVEGRFRKRLIEHAAQDIASLSGNDGGWTWLWTQFRGANKRQAIA